MRATPSSAVIALLANVSWMVGGCSDQVATTHSPSGAAASRIAVKDTTTEEHLATGFSVFVTYRTDGPPQGRAPANRDSTLRARGAEFVFDDTEARVLSVAIPKDRFAAIVSLPWATKIEVDSSVARISADVVPWGVAELNALALHAEGYTGTVIKVGVLDGGINCQAPELQGRIVGGYDFVNNNSTFCHSQANSGPDHGTRVAHVIAAIYNLAGIVGMAPNASLYSLRVCDTAGNCDAARINSAITWARNNGMHVTNASIGNCGQTLAASQQVNHNAAWTVSKIVTVWAAGNGAIPGLPPNTPCRNTDPVSGYARTAYGIAVAGHQPNGLFTANGQYGPEIDLSAPTGVPTFGTLFGGAQTTIGNTSGAAPHVAGAAALLANAGWAFLPDEIWRRLRESVIPVTPPDQNHYGYGKPEVYRARHLLDVSITGPSFPAQGNQTWTAATSGGIAPFTYAWERQNACSGGVWFPVGTNSTYSVFYTSGEQFMLRVNVTSAALNMTRMAAKIIGGLPSC